MIREFVINAPRGGGKTTFLAKQAAHYMRDKPNSRVMFLSPFWVMSEHAYEITMQELLNTCPFNVNFYRDKQSIGLLNGSRVWFHNARKNATKGMSLDLMLVDEVGRLDEETWLALRPMVKNGGTIYYTKTVE